MLRGPGGSLRAAQEAELLSWLVQPQRTWPQCGEVLRVEARIGILRLECFFSSQREGLGCGWEVRGFLEQFAVLESPGRGAF